MEAENTHDQSTRKPNENQSVIDALEVELQSIDETSFPNLHAMAQSELYKLRGGIADWVDVTGQRKVKIRAKVAIPVDSHPGFNFVGKLLGPSGSTLKSIQEQTMTKMAILGQGSVRNEEKERELLNSGDPKYQHLKQKLHLQIDSLAPPSEAYYRLSHALAEVTKYMTPDENDFNWNQGGGFQQGARGGRGGMMRGGRGAPGGRGMGAPRGRGMGRGRGRGGAGDFGASGNGMDGFGAQSYDQGMGGYDASAGATGFEQGYQQSYEGNFGTGYDQTDPWGKARGGGAGRGQGNRGFPYARPSGNAGAATNGARPY